MSNERRYRVLTAVGPDRPGLVQELSGAIHQASANLEDSRMAILGGEFALILLYSGTKEGMARLDAELPGLEERLQLRIAVRDTTRAVSTRSHLPYRIRVSGVDRPGIVARVSRVLAVRGINVESLESRVSPAPHSGTPLFLLRAELQVPSETALSALRAELSQVCDEENLDLLLEAG